MFGKITVLGGFDGVHVGHRALLERAASLRSFGGVVTVLTFEGTKSSRIMPNCLREQYLRLFGADDVIFMSFEAVRDMSPLQFVEKILVGKLESEVCICGFNYRFGKGASGDCLDLAALLSERGIGCEVVEAVCAPTLEEVPISSTEIRSLITEGKIEEATALLGHPFFISSEVKSGKKLGRTWGFPTANQELSEGVCPKNGVYATFAMINGEIFPSVTNIGVCPTVTRGEKRLCETHIIGFDGDIYKKILTVGFISRLRGEVRFSSPEELCRQIKEDRASAEAIFEGARGGLILPKI